MSVASTMRASIITWRTGMSMVAIILRTASSRDGMSCTNRMLVRGSATTLPRLEMIGMLVPPPPPAATPPLSRITISEALV